MTPDPIEGNRALWDELVPIHLASKFYDVEGFLAGRSSLRQLEIVEVGDVADRDLLHLQCHFGLDTLSWARRGARPTGVDFSPAAIDAARDLSRRSGAHARFLCSGIPEPRIDNSDGTYADRSAHINNPAYEWYHPLGDVVSAVLDAGLHLEFLREHPVSPERLRLYMVEAEDGWRIPGDPLPLVFSLRATKP